MDTFQFGIMTREKTVKKYFLTVLHIDGTKLVWP